MERIIAVYTGTGNTLYAARKIEGYRTVLIEKVLSGEEAIPEDTECLGFAFPAYCWGVAYPMRRFIREYMAQRDNSALKYAFALLTMASTPLYTLADFDKELGDIGIALAYSACVKMPDAYLPLQKKAVPEEKAREAFAKADIRLREISGEIAKETISVAKRGPLFRFIRAVSIKAITPQRNRLSADGRCIKCSLCERICPMGNIRMSEKGPGFGSECISCFACYHRCPQNAIAYPGARGQYRGPVPSEELIRR